ncbi:hypothetical protein ACFONG_14320 [Uliginosibacterium paludis]|uniref:MSHA biogenesis protein MshJ n=1 Tax=Uliginosibacterium paludis TaxID=1615952 RepID=A0ABV2CVR4_9RHOO
MKKLWLKLADRFDAMMPRERLMVFLALIAVVSAIFYFWSLNPALVRYQLVQQQMQQDEKLLRGLDEEELALIRAASADPDAAVRAQIEASRQELAAVQAELGGAGGKLVEPAQAARMLRDLIKAQGGSVELVSMQAGEVQNLLVDSESTSRPAPAVAAEGGLKGLYRHRLRLALRGDYAALNRYVGQLEKLPWNMQVAELKLSSERWPQARLELVLHVISLERAWLAF